MSEQEIVEQLEQFMTASKQTAEALRKSVKGLQQAMLEIADRVHNHQNSLAKLVSEINDLRDRVDELEQNV